jgi:hypothetical protein
VSADAKGSRPDVACSSMNRHNLITPQPLDASPGTNVVLINVAQTAP